jgi:pimeloyl-ACP methyl ester carboxylesterase
MVSTSRQPGRWPRVTAWTTLALFLLLFAGYAGISVWTAEVLTRPTNHESSLDPRMVGRDATAWSTRTSDGLILRGWYIPTPGRRHLVVLIHGMGGCWEELAALGRDLHRQDYDILLFDLRGHGESDPSRLFMGRRERADIRAVLAWASRTGFDPDEVGWLGQSMGASTLLMEAAQNPGIRVVVADSPYGNLPELLKSQLTRHSHLPSWFNPGILLAARLTFGVRTDDLIPIRSARAWGNRPLLLIHGEADTIVPVRQAKALALALGPGCLTVTLPGVEHVQAYREDPRGYVTAVHKFYQSHLRP